MLSWFSHMALIGDTATSSPRASDGVRSVIGCDIRADVLRVVLKVIAALRKAKSVSGDDA